MLGHVHDTHYLVAPWHWLLLPGLLGMGAASLASIFLRRRAWSVGRRVLMSASLMPILVVVFALFGWLLSSPGAEGWEDLIGVLWLTVALGGGAIAFAGGLAAAAAIEWYRRA